MIIDNGKLKKYMSNSNEIGHPMIICIGNDKDAVNYFNATSSYLFSTIDDLKKNIGMYCFEYDGKWYHILKKEALDVITDRETLLNPIRDNKALHMAAVAEHMARMSHTFGISPEDAYLLGYMHDIGYIRGRVGHGKNGADLLETVGVRKDFLNAIKYHGSNPKDVPKECITPYLVALWDGDCSVDTNGNDIGYSKRLSYIKERYGEKSRAYINVSAQMEYCKNYIESKGNE